MVLLNVISEIILCTVHFLLYSFQVIQNIKLALFITFTLHLHLLAYSAMQNKYVSTEKEKKK